MREPEERYIVEFIPMGNAVRVTAVDPETGREATISGPPAAGQKELAQLAVRKLKYILEKESRHGTDAT